MLIHAYRIAVERASADDKGERGRSAGVSIDIPASVHVHDRSVLNVNTEN